MTPPGHALLNGPQVGRDALGNTGEKLTGDKGWGCQERSLGCCSGLVLVYFQGNPVPPPHPLWVAWTPVSSPLALGLRGA